MKKSDLKSNQNIAIIGDIHGNYKTLVEIISQIKSSYGDGCRIISVGDLVDRGPRSKEVIQFIIENSIETVLGNHEVEMIKCVEEHFKYGNIFQTQWYKSWGGKETLESYNVLSEYNKGSKEDLSILSSHIEWLKTLPYYIDTEMKYKEKKIIISHANIQLHFHRKDEYKTEFNHNAIWNRDFIFDSNIDIINIFGHTPLSYPFINEYLINIDTGCFIKNKDDRFGNLTAVILPNLNIISIKNID